MWENLKLRKEYMSQKGKNQKTSFILHQYISQKKFWMVTEYVIITVENTVSFSVKICNIYLNSLKQENMI